MYVCATCGIDCLSPRLQRWVHQCNSHHTEMAQVCVIARSPCGRMRVSKTRRRVELIARTHTYKDEYISNSHHWEMARCCVIVASPYGRMRVSKILYGHLLSMTALEINYILEWSWLTGIHFFVMYIWRCLMLLLMEIVVVNYVGSNEKCPYLSCKYRK